MTSVLQQVSARELGAGRWRVEMEAADPRARPSAGAVSPAAAVRPAGAGSPGARVEAVTPPTPAAPLRWGVVIALDDPGAPARSAVTYDVSHAGWTGRIVLAAGADEPSPIPPQVTESAAPRADIDYRARDFDALRQMMLSLVGERAGNSTAAQPVSQSVALVEELAYLGDNLSYFQDAVATEAYLATARRRISVTRHAALLAYPVSEGASARTWARIEVSEPLTLPARTPLLTRAADLPARVEPAALPSAVNATAAPLVFETVAEVALEPGPRDHELDPETHHEQRLAAGATSATVSGHSRELEPGALVLIEPAPGGPPPGHVVRLTEARAREDEDQRPLTHVAWAPADAVPDDPMLTDFAVRLRVGNLVVADHGMTLPWAPLPEPQAGERYWPQLPHPDPTFAIRGAPDDQRSAAYALLPDDAAPEAAVQLREHGRAGVRQWRVRSSLLESGQLATDFVVEVESDRSGRLRFGDNVNGQIPQPGARMEVRMRVGGGERGDIGAAAIAHVVTADPRVLSATNPSGARGGRDPETLTSVRLNAPAAFRTTERVVTEADYVAQARTVPGVADATAAIDHNGSWPVARLYVHSGDWNPPEGMVARVRARVQPHQPVGVDLDVRGALPAAVGIELDVVTDAGWDSGAVAAGIDRALRSTFLRPGRFGFGDGLHRSEVVTLAAAVPGVSDATLRRFDWARPTPGEPAHEALVPPFGHVIRVDNDPVAPEHGWIDYVLRPRGR